MRNLMSTLGLAVLIVPAACAAPGARSTSLLPQSAAPAVMAAGPGGQSVLPDTQSALIETPLDYGGVNYLAPDLQGNVWFGLTSPVALATIGEHSLNVELYDLPTKFVEPDGIALSPQHDAMWFTDLVSNAIGSIGLSNHTVERFKIPTDNAFPMGIAAGPDNAMWFTEYRTNKIGRIDLANDTITEFSLPASEGAPWRITLGPDGDMWFSAFHGIGHIKTNGHFNVYAIGSNKPYGITSGPDGGVWFTGESESKGSMFGRIDPKTHTRKLFKYSAGSKGNQDLVFRGSSMYMTRPYGNRIDRFDLGGHTVYSRSLPHDYSQPWGITLGSDNQIWFTNLGPTGAAIGKLCPGLSRDQCKGK
jgi:virginiamycin B lyase